MATPLANNSIMALQPYQPGTPIAQIAREFSIPEASISKLASNENPRGPSRAAVDAATRALNDSRLYPDTYELTATLAAHHKVNPDSIILGNGSNDVLDLIARTYLDAESEAIIYKHSFLVYKIVSKAAGATVIETEPKNYGYNLDAILQAITPKTRVIWIDNPNNPTGTFINHSDIKRFLKKVPEQVLVVLDDAYWDYLPDNLRTDTVRLTEEYVNVIITRTFSKIHGLAALRVGYGVGNPAIIEPLNRIRQPFNVNSVAIAAAIATIQDIKHIEHERQENEHALRLMTDELDQLGMEYIYTYTNFITIVSQNAQLIHQYLLERGVITRAIDNYSLKNHLRITLGSKDEVRKVVALLNKFMIENK